MNIMHLHCLYIHTLKYVKQWLFHTHGKWEHISSTEVTRHYVSMEHKYKRTYFRIILPQLMCLVAVQWSEEATDPAFISR